jgi:hypothetical protein
VGTGQDRAGQVKSGQDTTGQGEVRRRVDSGMIECHRGEARNATPLQLYNASQLTVHVADDEVLPIRHEVDGRQC